MATKTPPTGEAGHRSLADQLRSWSDERLAGLLVARPDLVTPAPHDFGQLASRAAVRASLSRALDALTRLELSVLDALVVAGQTPREDVAATVAAAPDAVEAALDLLVERRDALASLISAETGKPRLEALTTEVMSTLELCDFYLRQSERLLAPRQLPHRLLKTTRSQVVREPWGVVGLITPWNYPFFMSAGIGLSALFAGNAIL